MEALYTKEYIDRIRMCVDNWDRLLMSVPQPLSFDNGWRSVWVYWIAGGEMCTARCRFRWDESPEPEVIGMVIRDALQSGRQRTAVDVSGIKDYISLDGLMEA